jgi:serine/threonine protein kinase
MSYCINPWCSHRKNADPKSPNSQATHLAAHCQACGTPLLIQGRYRLIRPLRELDEWEPSEIFEVDDGGQIKVLKILKKASFQSQFEREVKTLQHLDHPGIPAVALDGDFVVQIGARSLFCLVMEKIQGQNLDEWLQQYGSLNQSQAADWMRQLVEVLKALHGEGLFHRDIKLSNIMLRPTGQLALIDFGTVRPMSGTYFAKISGQRDITSVVSPGYTPLEQINGKAVPQSDFYALGRSMVYLLTGQHPIDLPENETTGQIEWRSHSLHPVTDGFAHLLDDMMAPFVAQRPLNAETVLARLQQSQSQSNLNPDLSEKDARQIPRQILGKTDAQKKQWLNLLVAINIAVFLLNGWLGWRWTKTYLQKKAPQSAALVESPLLSANIILRKPSSPTLLPMGEGSRSSKSLSPWERDLG